jgi:hypothetical protein
MCDIDTDNATAPVGAIRAVEAVVATGTIGTIVAVEAVVAVGARGAVENFASNTACVVDAHSFNNIHMTLHCSFIASI